MAKKNSIVVGLDIGTSKVCAVVGEMTDRQTGLVVVGVVGGLGLLLAAILTAILIYSFSWGYAVQL
jgi:hypothetical protein